MALVTFATSLFVRAVDPVMSKIAGDFAMDAGTVALLSTAFALPYAVTQPLLGAMADILGKTRLMTLCLVVLMAAALVGAAATSFSMLLVSRVVSGIVAGGIFPISLAIAGDLVPRYERQVAISRLLAAAMFGNLLGSPGAGSHRVARHLRPDCMSCRRGIQRCRLRLSRCRLGRASCGRSCCDPGGLSHHLPKPARQDLLWRGPARSHLRLRTVPIRGVTAARQRRAACLDRGPCHRWVYASELAPAARWRCIRPSSFSGTRWARSFIGSVSSTRG
jgi:Major Facilitator Superfamily